MIYICIDLECWSFFDQENLTSEILPYVEAIRAHVKGDRGFLRNIIPEARGAAEKIFDEIERRRKQLPETTRRCER